ncbi:MAG: hypothetical protein JWM58_4061 [Rhizobium sp.]|nr:hypothetical protein [Rhizobium sp.]
MSLPDFICIGAQKAGTTWLYEMLAQNPSIWLPPLKEVHFFDHMDSDDDVKNKRRAHIEKIARRAAKGGRAKGSTGEGKADFLFSLTGDNLLTEEWYRSIFSHPDSQARISGEVTPAYLALEEDKLAYVKSLLPNTRFLLIVREPKARNLSQIKMAAARSRNDDLTDADWKGFLRKLKINDRGNYARSIPLWQKFFGPEQLMILPFSLVRTDPAGMIATIEKHIGATPFNGYKSLDEQVHKTKEIKLPDWVVEDAAKRAEPQKEYLINAFGADFYEKTK